MRRHRGWEGSPSSAPRRTSGDCRFLSPAFFHNADRSAWGKVPTSFPWLRLVRRSVIDPPGPRKQRTDTERIMPLDPLADLRERLTKLEILLRSRFLERSSVDQGRMTFIESELLMQGGSRLKGEGTFTWTGPATIRGSLNIEGPAKVTGDMDIQGLTRLLSELIVEGGKITAGDVRIEDGKVHVGGMALDPDVAGGALTFPNGSRLEADDDNEGERLVAGNSVVNVGEVASIRKGSTSVIVSGIGVTVNAGAGNEILLQGAVRIPLASVPTYSGTGLPQGTLRLSTTGNLERADGS